MYSALRPLLFSLNPETAHDLTLATAAVVGKSVGPGKVPVCKPRQCMGLNFQNPVGLAAGLDKDATAFNGLARCGFGFIEVGTVTPRAQPGNPKPRMFRLPEHNAVINRMGFNNQGLDAFLHHIKQRKYQGILGINLGKNKDSSDASADYVTGLSAVHALADYITVNLSSPNTPGLRDLQLGEGLLTLLADLSASREQCAQRDGKRTPMLVKLAPDLADDDLKWMGDALVEAGIDGIIATNTTLDQNKISGHKYFGEAGGLSGAPVRPRANECIKLLRKNLGQEVCLVGVGGIDSPKAALERLAAGADLIQLYTGLVFQGPGLVKQCLNELA